MRYLSVCSGIEAATVAWHPLGWTPAAFSEIEAFPRSVLAHHYPDVPCHGDFTTIGADDYGPIDLLVGGTPCQSFSIAGLRKGLADERGNLALEFLRLADRKSPRWLVWENVPGVLSSNGGRDFGAFLGGLVELGYGFAYRVLDAQFFGVAQRRRRVFVVGYLGDWRRAAAVLFERHSLSGHPAPRREKGKESATRTGFSTVGSLSGGYGAKLGTDESCQGSVIPWPADVCPTLDTYYADKMGLEDQHVFNQRGGKFVPVAIQERATSENPDAGPDGAGFRTDGAAYTLEARTVPQAVAFSENQQGAVRQASAVRRLTPVECERLQGFPEMQKSYTVLLCRNYSDLQKSNALAALQNRKSQSNVWLADARGWMLSVESAAHHSSTSLVASAPPVAVDVLIDLERLEVHLRSAERSMSIAANAGGQNEFPLPTGITSFAQLVALLTHVWALAMRDGKAASPASTTPSTLHQNGSSIAIPFGSGIDGHAADVASAIAMAIRLSTSTTLPSGLDTATLASTLATLSSCVAHAIAGFIPEATSKASSFAVRLTTTQGYTAVSHRGKPAADGPRYKALGNSMAVPVMSWIGRRIALVEALNERKAAA